MTRVIKATGTKDEVLEKLRAMKVGNMDGTLTRVLDALTEHVETSVDGGNKHIEVSVSIGARFEEG